MVLLAACSGLEQPDQDLFIDDGENLVERIVFDVLPIKDADDHETRASAVPNGSTVNFAWEVTDTVGIFPDKGSQAFFSMESGAGTSSANFDGGGWALKQGTSYISYYPLVGEFYLDRTKIPVSFADQKQIGTSSPFHGARYFLATEPTSSENGVLRFSYKTLNTIINVNATLPAGTYTKASLTVSEPLFVEEGTYSLDEQTIVGKTYSNTLKIDLENVTLTQEGVLPIYIMSAPVDLKNKEVTVMVISSDGKKYECVKTPSKAYAAGTRYGLTCDQMEGESQPNNVIYYVSSDGNIVIPYNTNSFGASIVSNEYQNGRGKITFDGEVTSIGKDAFYKCSSLIGISIPESVTSIGTYAFGSSGLTSVVLPEKVTDIGTFAFSNCFHLLSIVIPNTVTDIGHHAFMYCSSLTTVTLPSQLNSIASDLFMESGLTSITIPEGVTAIDGSAFYSCKSLSSVSLPSTLTSIGFAAFHECQGLTSIVIPASVTSIGDWAFCQCYSLTSITVHATVPPTGVTGTSFASTDSCPIFVPASCIETYKAADGWSAYANRIQAWAILSEDILGPCDDFNDEYGMKKLQNKFYVKKLIIDTSRSSYSFWGICMVFNSDDDSHFAAYWNQYGSELAYSFSPENHDEVIVDEMKDYGTPVSDHEIEIDFTKYSDNVYIWGYQMNVLLSTIRAYGVFTE